MSDRLSTARESRPMKLMPWTHPLRRTITVPGDKSITHRAILFSALAKGPVTVTQWLDAKDTRSSLRVVRALGVEVTETPGKLVLRGPQSLAEPKDVVDCGNSGTTMRLSMGLLSALPEGLAVLTGDASLRQRPMGRVAGPLSQIGVDVFTRSNGNAPVVVRGGLRHVGGQVTMSVASAQVKSALLLAGLSAHTPVTVVEPITTRDHTERMLRAMGASLRTEGNHITVTPGDLQGISINVPGDPSSAAFWAALAVLVPGSRLEIQDVLLNPSRIGFYRMLEQMGAKIRFDGHSERLEPVGNIVIESSELHGVEVGAHHIPDMVDEIPLVALLATMARGSTRITGAEELRVKESDRIHATMTGLVKMGATIEELPDGFVIKGGDRLKGAEVEAFDDHRIAMMLTVASTVADGPTWLSGAESIGISYPEFMTQIHESGTLG